MISILRGKISARALFIVLGPLLYFIIQRFVILPGLSIQGLAVLAATVWIALWWITEAVPIPVTSLLPIILFPLSGVSDIETATSPYANPIIYLYIGGFMLAVAIERWNLHRRIALSIIYRIGTQPKKVVLGFMLATAFLSMWISNTATSVMMLPIGIAVINQISKKGDRSIGKVLMLGIAYSASIGGIATLIGTPTNVVLVGVVRDLYEVELSFLGWMVFALPLSVVLLAICWYYLVRGISSTQLIDRSFIKEKLIDLGPMSTGERRVAMLFAGTAFLWITRKYLVNPWLPGLDDSMVALLAVLLLFIIPSGNSQQPQLLTWKQAERIPWGIVLLFGGGLSLANAFKISGLATYIGNQIELFQFLPLLIITLIIVALVNFLTEVTSNVATASMLLPILGAMSLALDIHPYVFLVPASIAASCAFMLPVATPPNAVVFGSGMIKISEMARAGVVLNIISVILVTLFIYYGLPLFWDFDRSVFPVDWKI